MKLSIIGAGHVGLIAGACLAECDHQVQMIESDQKRLDLLASGNSIFHEPNLERLLNKNSAKISFSGTLDKAVEFSDVIFVAVGTANLETGQSDMDLVLQVCKEIATKAKSKKFIVLKSTIEIGYSQTLQKLLKQISNDQIEIINNPEFLREGSAVEDFLSPDRIIIGCQSKEAENLMREIYQPLINKKIPMFVMDNVSAELTKYAANAYLSVKISFVNELANLADKVGANIEQVKSGFTSDSRINAKFFNQGIGFGGSCFPKDLHSLVSSGEKMRSPMRISAAAEAVNLQQRVLLVEWARNYFGDLKGKKFAVWGLSFKPNTDDVREAPAGYMISELVKLGAQVVGFDPVAGNKARNHFKTSFSLAESAIKATLMVDALFIATEWSDFRNPNLDQLKNHMKTPVIFDGRNLLDPEKTRAAGFEYFCVGQSNTRKESSSWQKEF